MDMSILLGRPLDQAEKWLAENGLAPKITITSDPRHAREDGTLRVLRVTATELVAARFRDEITGE